MVAICAKCCGGSCNDVLAVTAWFVRVQTSSRVWTTARHASTAAARCRPHRFHFLQSFVTELGVAVEFIQQAP